MVNNSVFLQSFGVALCWAIASTLEKYYLLDKFTSYELLLLRAIVFVFVGIFFICITEPTPFENIRKNSKYILGSIGVFSIGVVGTLLFWEGIKKNNVGTFTSMVSPIRIGLVVLFGFIFYKEMITKVQFIAILLAIASTILFCL